MRTNQSVGPGELKVLTFLSEKGPLSVREVADTLGVELGVRLTTIQQMMERLRKKGLLKREKVSGSFRYSALHQQEEVMRSLVDRFIKNSLGGSVGPFVRYLAEARNLSEEDVQELSELVAQLRDRNDVGAGDGHA
jgi:predicted transcriptional regulator